VVKTQCIQLMCLQGFISFPYQIVLSPTHIGEFWIYWHEVFNNKIFLGYQPCQLVKRWKNQRFEGHLCPHLEGTDVSGESVRVIYRPVRIPYSWRCAPSWTLNLDRPVYDTDWFSRYINTLKTRTEMVLETLDFFHLLTNWHGW
jgi:hypothetical protein